MVLLFCGLSILSGCATTGGSVLLGASAGAAAGAGVGSVASPESRSQGAVTGALIGAVVGGLSGLFVHKTLESRDNQTRRETLFNLEKFNVSSPRGASSSDGHGLTMPVVESQWVDTEVQGKKLVEGHRVWVITEEPQWVPGKNTKTNKEK